MANVKTLRNDAEEKAYEKSLHPGLFEEWKTGLNAGFALTRGNSETKNLSIGFLATRQTLHDKLGLYETSVYASNDAAGAVPSTTANTAGGGLRYDHSNHRIECDARPVIIVRALAGGLQPAISRLELTAIHMGLVGI